MMREDTCACCNRLCAELAALRTSLDKLHKSKDSGQAVRLLSARQAAAYLGVSKSIIYRLMHGGELPVLQVSEHMKFDVEDLNAFILREKS
jgi:excisionase family DNA binding protein